MAKHLVQDTSLTAIADAIRAKTGGTEPLMFPGGMTEAIAGITGGEDLDAELAVQDELIDQIFTAIDEKSAAISSGGGGSGGGGSSGGGGGAGIICNGSVVTEYYSGIYYIGG